MANMHTCLWPARAGLRGNRHQWTFRPSGGCRPLHDAIATAPAVKQAEHSGGCSRAVAAHTQGQQGRFHALLQPGKEDQRSRRPQLWVGGWEGLLRLLRMQRLRAAAAVVLVSLQVESTGGAAKSFCQRPRVERVH
jgi:hypothetical protein